MTIGAIVIDANPLLRPLNLDALIAQGMQADLLGADLALEAKLVAVVARATRRATIQEAALGEQG